MPIIRTVLISVKTHIFSIVRYVYLKIEGKFPIGTYNRVDENEYVYFYCQTIDGSYRTLFLT